MSGNHIMWTPEHRAKAAERMRTRWQDPAYREQQSQKRRAFMNQPEQRAFRSALMSELNERMKTDIDLKSTHLASVLRAYLSPERRRKLGERVRQDWERNPERKERQRAIAKKAASRAGKARWRKIHARIPEGFRPLYDLLRRKVGSEEAIRIVRAEAKRKGAPQ